jgi:hypothetical protein
MYVYITREIQILKLTFWADLSFSVSETSLILLTNISVYRLWLLDLNLQDNCTRNIYIFLCS